MPLAAPTSDHDTIKSWALSQKAVPAELLPASRDELTMTLRFLFLDGSPDPQTLQPLTWDDFFTEFDRQGLSVACGDGLAESDANSYEFHNLPSGTVSRFKGNAV